MAFPEDLFDKVVETDAPTLALSLAVAGVLFSVVSLYYYMRIVAAFFLVKPREAEAGGYGALWQATLAVLAVATLVLGVAPTLVTNMAEKAANGMIPRV